MTYLTDINLKGISLKSPTVQAWLKAFEAYLKLNSIVVFLFSIVRAGDAIYVRVGDHDLTQKYGSPGA